MLTDTGSIEPDSPGTEISDRGDKAQNDREAESPETGLVNPLATGPPAFMSSGSGRLFYLGTSSNWSFTRRVLSATHRHVYQEPLPTDALTFEGTAYDLGHDGPQARTAAENPVIPSLDHALYLTETVTFRCGQIYHLFDRSEFVESLYSFYSKGNNGLTGSIWYIHFLLILAFGKALSQVKSQQHTPPGFQYFAKAMHLLPDHNQLYSTPMLSTEILCCIALFYQSLDCRSAAHNYIGQAMRMAMSHGMHMSMPIKELGDHAVERCRRIWWTVYNLDRQMTCIQGLPQSIDDRFMQASLPSFPESPERVGMLNLHIKLSQSLSDINKRCSKSKKAVYAIDGRISKDFLLSTKETLSKLASLADELRETFPLRLYEGDTGIPRASAYLHLFYQQVCSHNLKVYRLCETSLPCVIVATRPLLFCFLKIRFESPETCGEFLDKSRNLRNLIQMCLESAQYSIRILLGLKSQGLLETCLSFDLESIFISTVVLLMGPVIDPTLVDDPLWWPEKAFEIFRAMVEAGNRVARLRWIELQQLDRTLRDIPSLRAASSDPKVVTGPLTLSQLISPATTDLSPSGDQGYHPLPSSLEDFCSTDQDFGFGPSLSSTEMAAMADSIEIYDAEWVSNAMMVHDIW
ncbi:hypothetical protein N7541_005450 [Penicillium brevicompactum]|uniref:Xylanolytic transcriptional activator regulatory domain-containing protein n=1 Tax=Penicillium brevicompactum TaxID=5074 RepID=A0A9W9RE05_PENBR|nr:hypothetical protein N7541_005450 [Penicillium brevicompactum]